MGKISEYRERLDRTLASAELTSDDALKTLIRNQLLQSSTDENEGCSENVIEKKTAEVSYFLDVLRSASVSEHEASKTAQTSHDEWKLKDDNKEYRVMYRQGPHGTPLHTLLVEGYVDGPLDTCLCISWEASLYRKWWPQMSFPPFKITSCKCLQKIRIGEHISLLRVKTAWPLSAREAVVHYFLFEYLKDGLVVVLVNTISDMETIEKNSHGFTRDGIPEVKDVVRIDVVGGFAIQKVTSERSYFRTITTVDLKLDFVPPSLINFISRQLIGSGFRLYQKAVAAVSSYDEDYSKVLEDPMYARIREVLYSNVTMEGKETESDVFLPLQEHPLKDVEKNLGDMEHSVHGGEGASESTLENAQVTDNCEIEEDKSEDWRQMKDGINGSEQATDTAQGTDRNDRVIEILQNNAKTIDRKAFGEIEEEEGDDSVDLENGDKNIGQPFTNTVAHMSPVNYKTNVLLSPEVERALATLEKAISLVRECGIDSLARFSPGLAGNETPNLQKDAEKDLTSPEDGGLSSDTEVSVEIAEKGKIVQRTSCECRNSSSNCDLRCAGSNSHTTEVNHNKIAPASPEQHLSSPSESNHVLHFSKDGIAELTLEDAKQMNIEVNGIHENSLQEKKKLSQQKNHMLCCFGLGRPQVIP